MKKLLRAGLIAAAVLGVAGPRAQAAADPEAIQKAIDRGVAALRRMQTGNGTWPHQEIGATSLAGLTLLECGVPADDRAVQQAADAVRRAAVSLTHTYSVSLTILFLDRLGEPGDVPLIESLTVRLLAGQTPHSGGWNYNCPQVSDAEVRRLQAQLGQRKVLVGGREPPKPGARKTTKDLPKEIQQQLAQLNRGGVPAVGPPAQRMGSDNSNTQFATLALWVGRRHGLPVEKALARVETRFRTNQNADGGWGYFDKSMAPPGGPRMSDPTFASTASMTCAGLLGIAVADGAVIEAARDRHPGAKPARDMSKDPSLRKGLLTLASAIDTPAPRGVPRKPGERQAAMQVGGKTYYFLWSLERVGVAIGLDTIGKKDWYAWGTGLLLANQRADGSWQGEYGPSGADTCFALLFLKRANLARDLSAQLRGQLQDEKILAAGGVGGEGLSGTTTGGNLKPGVESAEPKPIVKPPEPKDTPPEPKDTRPQPTDTRPPTPEPKPITKPPEKVEPAPAGDSDSARLAGELVKATPRHRGEVLDKLRLGKGVVYTEALASAIPQLPADAKGQARSALAERLVRMKTETLAKYMQDEDGEIRRAAAAACAKKEARTLIPNLIALLRDREGAVVGAAHTALKQLTGEDFGPAPGAGRQDRDEAAQRWLEWWGKQGGK